MSRLALLLCASLVPACSLFAPAVLDVAQSDQAQSLQLQMSATGRPARMSYLVPPDTVPAAVRQAMERLHPGEPLLEAQREVVEQRVLWVLSRRVDSRLVQAHFRTDGTLVSEALEVPAEEVPPAVVEMVVDRFPEATDLRWTRCRDEVGRVTAYRAELLLAGRRYLAELQPEGQLLAAWRDVPASIQVPLRRP